MPLHSLYNEKELLERISKGDELAFTILHDKYWRRIYTVALLYIKSPQAAQDVVQDVFLKIWLNKANLTTIRELTPYLLVTARNVIISSLRNKVFHDYLNTDEQLEESILLPERRLAFKESVNLLHQAIKKLPLQQQKAYLLSRDENMSYEEIAEQMEISPLTVRNHITRALETIRKFMKDNDFHPIILIIYFFFKKV